MLAAVMHPAMPKTPARGRTNIAPRFAVAALSLALSATLALAAPQALAAGKKKPAAQKLAKVAPVALAAPAAVLSQDDIAKLPAIAAARDAFRAGDRARLARIAAPLQGHVLQPYLDYWQLRQRLEEASEDEIRAFLAKQGNTPTVGGGPASTYVGELLRRDWLRLLVKRNAWDTYLKEHPWSLNDEPDLACFHLLARWNSHADLGALDEVREFWSAPRELPDGCVPVAEALLARQPSAAPMVWGRFRMLVEANQLAAAKRVLAWLPASESMAAGRADAVLGAPARFVEHLPDLASKQNRELAMLALQRIARSEPQVAASYWDAKLREKFTPDEQAHVWGQIGLFGARRLVPDAVDWFAAAGEAQLPDEHLAWRARIALREGRWDQVRAAILRMSPLSRNDPAWLYWLGRAAQVLEPGKPEAARALFTRIAGDPHFYGLLAAEELGLPMKLPARIAPLTRAELDEAAGNPGLRRALALMQAGLRLEGIREWNWSLRGMEDRQLLAAAELARNNAAWDRVINTAERTLGAHDFTLRYLAPYRDVLSREARAQQLEEFWVLGLVRQESRFVFDAKSTVGASGLMQLMPATAKWVAGKMGLRDYHQGRVNDVDTNAQLGTFYLRQVLNDLDGSPVLASAAYNAGPGRARAWRAARPLEGAIYAESIPFNETRDYVKKVMANTVYYAAVLAEEQRAGKLHAGEPQPPARSLKSRLGVIAPKGGAASDKSATRDPSLP